MNLPMRPTRLLAALLLALPGAAAADVVLVGGRPVRCTWWQDGNEVVVNPYNSSNRAMTWGVERYPRSKVNLEKVRPTETPEEEYCRRAFEIRAGEAGDHASLAKWCEEKKLKDLAAREWERVLEREPANEEARKALGPAALKEVLRRNGKANPELGDLLRQYVAAENAATRRVLHERMRKDHDLALPASYLERAWRSAKRPGGRTDDVALTFRSDRVKGEAGALYTMFVPPDYDPLRPTPLLVGLHGGGRGGKDGKEVVGSGPSAMNFYTGIAERRGWLVVCPSAIQAPWGQEINGEFLEACLAEVELLYNVDLNRVYLTGHSMGGFGTWYWGPKWAERWAAIAPMAGGGCPGVERLKETQTFVYLFHGTDDNVCHVQPDRDAANQMLKGGNDFVYTELNGVGHGCPPEVLEEMSALFEVKRLAVGRGGAFRRSDEIRSSFLEKPGKEEKRYLGDPEPPDPTAKAETPEAKRKRLLADIDLGGGKADAAAAAYAEFKDAESVKSLGARAVSPKAGDDVRAAAAKALGNIGLPEGLPFLEKALADENDGVFLAATASVVALGDRKAGPALLRAVEFQAKRFEGKFMGTTMDFSDYEKRCAALGAAARAAAALGDAKEAVARIRDRVVKPVYEATYRVQFEARINESPPAVRAALAKDLCDALVKTGHASAKEALLALKAAGTAKSEGDVALACDEALARLAGGGAPSAPPAEGQ
jgi:poly(3-hydroxybutyrate) depolymerase